MKVVGRAWEAFLSTMLLAELNTMGPPPTRPSGLLQERHRIL